MCACVLCLCCDKVRCHQVCPIIWGKLSQLRLIWGDSRLKWWQRQMTGEHLAGTQAATAFPTVLLKLCRFLLFHDI